MYSDPTRSKGHFILIKKKYVPIHMVVMIKPKMMYVRVAGKKSTFNGTISPKPEKGKCQVIVDSIPIVVTVTKQK